MFLNFGHTFGHAIETLSEFRVSHGESVSIGIAMASRLSQQLGDISEHDFNRIKSHLELSGLPTRCPYSIDEMIPIMRRDKKVRSDSSLTFILLEKLGKAKIREDVKTEDLKQVF
jgi:3-dehydroquinate synthase